MSRLRCNRIGAFSSYPTNKYISHSLEKLKTVKSGKSIFELLDLGKSILKRITRAERAGELERSNNKLETSDEKEEASSVLLEAPVSRQPPAAPSAINLPSSRIEKPKRNFDYPRSIICWRARPARPALAMPSPLLFSQLARLLVQTAYIPD